MRKTLFTEAERQTLCEAAASLDDILKAVHAEVLATAGEATDRLIAKRVGMPVMALRKVLAQAKEQRLVRSTVPKTGHKRTVWFLSASGKRKVGLKK